MEKEVLRRYKCYVGFRASVSKIQNYDFDLKILIFEVLKRDCNDSFYMFKK